MKYEISLSEDNTFIRIRVFETINGEIEREFAGKAITEAKQRNIRQFLVDVRGTTNVASSFQHYLFGYEDMEKLGLALNSKIAVLADESDRTHDFIETIFINAGHRCRLFRVEKVALEWLLLTKQ